MTLQGCLEFYVTFINKGKERNTCQYRRKKHMPIQKKETHANTEERNTCQYRRKKHMPIQKKETHANTEERNTCQYSKCSVKTDSSSSLGISIQSCFFMKKQLAASRCSMKILIKVLLTDSFMVPRKKATFQLKQKSATSIQL